MHYLHIILRVIVMNCEKNMITLVANFILIGIINSVHDRAQSKDIL